MKTVLEVLGVAILSVYTMAAWRQLSVMQGQLTEMQESRKQAKLDNTNAITAQRQIAETSLTASQTNFKKSLEQTQSSFRDDQRAWVGVSNSVISEFDPQKFVGQVEFTNSGKTPARKGRHAVAMMIHAFPLVDGPTPKEIGELAFTGKGSLPPQGKFAISTFPTAGSVDYLARVTKFINDRYPAIDAGREILYVFGEFEYFDVSDRRHTTKYCLHAAKVRENPVLWQLAFCNGFNEMD